MSTIALTDWTVQIRRELADLAGATLQGDVGGPYVTFAIFTGEDAEQRAAEVVNAMRPLFGDGIWAWSGEQIVTERRERLGA